jgi:hypothetical protein
MASYTDGQPPDQRGADENVSAVVLPFCREAAARRQPPAHHFTDSERSEIRDMLAWYRDVRPKLERLMTTCPTARRELSALLRGD